MAMACAHAYIPSTTSASMAETIRANSEKFSLTSAEDDIDPTKATERALFMVLRRITLTL